MNKIRMKRHESFSIREGWLTKGLIAIKQDGKIFSSLDATDILGIGSNMVKSLKYWMYATGLVEDCDKNMVVSELGTLISQYDPYFEDIFVWWLIHIHLNRNQKDAYLYHCFFNRCTSKNFSKQDIYNILSYHLDSLDVEYNEKILLDEVNMIVKTYVADDTNDNPENNFSCPLSSLELVRKVGKYNYERIKPSYRKLDYLVVYYLLELLMGNQEYISIDDLVKIENGPAKLLNLDKNLINEYLDDMKKAGLITINRTAGLNMIYRRKKMSLEQIMNEYFSRR